MKTLLEAIRHFSSLEVCIQTVAEMRWPDGKPHCAWCGKEEHYWLETQKRWKCKACKKQFSVKRGTIFEDSAIPLDKWLVALWMISNCRNGVSSYEIARSVGVTQKSAWFMLHRLRLAMKDNSSSKLGTPGPLGNAPLGAAHAAREEWEHAAKAVEVDESFVGGKLANMHRDRAIRLKKEFTENTEYEMRRDNKTPVVGMFDRESRQVRAKVVGNVKRETLQAEILKNVKYGSAIYTDSAVAYDKLRQKYVHETVNHAETYVNGHVHTNSLENFWSLMKRNLAGTYVAVEPFHLDRYLDEQVFRFNNRLGKTEEQRFNKALSQVAGKRLTFAEVTGKVGETRI